MNTVGSTMEDGSTPAAAKPDALSSYVTNLDRDVFALRNLPEEVIAVLFAYYSRSRDDLRTNLKKLLDDSELAMLEGGASSAPSLATAQGKARAFHEKWVVGYGHASVAEHAVVHLAVENCSIVAAKALEECRLAAYTEKSTRYVRFDAGTLVTDLGLPDAMQSLYETSARELLREYARLADLVEAKLIERHPTPEGSAPKAHANVLRTHACDLLRGLLPAGVPTNVGVTVNARSLEQHLGKLLGSPLREVRAIAEQMRTEATVIVPTLLKYTSPRAHRTEAFARVLPVVTMPPFDRTPTSLARLIDAPEDPLRSVAAAVLAEQHGAPWNTCKQAVSDERTARDVVRAYLSQRDRFDQPLRALEHATFSFEVRCDYGAWRDLQRHRMTSATTPRLDVSEGYWLSPELTELGVIDDCKRALDASAAHLKPLLDAHPWEAQYAVALAWNVRYVLRANLRELFHLIELRSAKQGHEAYRKVAQGLASALCEACPWLSEHLRVDRNDYPFARH